MSRRRTMVIAGSIVWIADAMTMISVVVALTTFPREEWRGNVVVPTERAEETRAADAPLDPTRDCAGNVRTLRIPGDAARVYRELEARR